MSDELIEPGPDIKQVPIHDDGEFVIATPETSAEWISCDPDYAIKPGEFQ